MFGIDVAKAAVERVGKPAVNHKQLALCGFGDSLSSCMEVGLGPDNYDCSGLVIAAICSALGRNIDTWPADLRHVRQIYRHAADSQANWQAGDLLIFGRRYLLDGQKRRVAAHIGVVIDPASKSYVHAADAYSAVVTGRVHDAGHLLRIINPESVIN